MGRTVNKNDLHLCLTFATIRPPMSRFQAKTLFLHTNLQDPMTIDVPAKRARDAAPPAVASAPGRTSSGAKSPRVVDSEVLLAGASQLAILHNQTTYFLRQTRFGKLILTK
jgi:hemin uptake protein HemP